jgi:predicted enzyme related to lactoylglutathione lyase
MPKVVHFEISAHDTTRAAAFYTKVFGWEIQAWQGSSYLLCKTGPDEQPGIGGAIMPAMHGQLKVINVIDVPSLEEYMDRVTQHGGKVISEKEAVPGVGWFAYCEDTEGNTIGIIQFDSSAK